MCAQPQTQLKTNLQGMHSPKPSSKQTYKVRTVPNTVQNNLTSMHSPKPSSKQTYKVCTVLSSAPKTNVLGMRRPKPNPKQMYHVFAASVGLKVMLRFNPKWDMHWLRTKQNREWFASKACSQNSGFSFGSF